MLALREYTGDIVNFKTYSKSFKNKTRIPNAEENMVVFKDVHEPIIDRDIWERVQEIKSKTKRRALKPENGEKNMFCDLLYCADCGSKLWYNVNHPNNLIQYFNCSNYRGNRGTCEATHYIRADSIEQVVLMELRELANFLASDEERFVAILERKTNKNLMIERKSTENALQTAITRNDEVSRLYERIYEDNVNGKISDERFMQLSHKYDTEQEALKKQIFDLREHLQQLDAMKTSKDTFIRAVRKFMEMKTLTPMILRELIDKIEVHQIQGTGKNRTQKIAIHYRFVGTIDLPDAHVRQHRLDTRQGVAVSYQVAAS